MDELIDTEKQAKVSAYLRRSASYVDSQGNGLGQLKMPHQLILSSHLYSLPEWVTSLVINSAISIKIIAEKNDDKPSGKGAFDVRNGELCLSEFELRDPEAFTNEIGHALDWILYQYGREKPLELTNDEVDENDTYYSLSSSVWKKAFKADYYEEDGTSKASSIRTLLESKPQGDPELYHLKQPLIELEWRLHPEVFLEGGEVVSGVFDDYGERGFPFEAEAFANLISCYLCDYYSIDAIRSSFPETSKLMEQEILPELERISNEIDTLENDNGLPLPWIERRGAEIFSERAEASQAYRT